MLKERAPVSPGEVIIHEYLDPLGWCVDDLADRSGIPVNKLRTILYNMEEVSEDVAEKLAETLGTTASFWLNLSTSFWGYWKQGDNDCAYNSQDVLKFIKNINYDTLSSHEELKPAVEDIVGRKYLGVLFHWDDLNVEILVARFPSIVTGYSLGAALCVCIEKEVLFWVYADRVDLATPIGTSTLYMKEMFLDWTQPTEKEVDMLVMATGTSSVSNLQKFSSLLEQVLSTKPSSRENLTDSGVDDFE